MIEDMRPRPLPALGAWLVALAILSVAPTVYWLTSWASPVELRPVTGLAGSVAPSLSDRPLHAPRWAGMFANFARARADRANARVAVYVRDVARNWEAGLDADRSVYLASGIKMLFMIELFQQREEGALSFRERIRYTEDFIRDGAPAMNRRRVGGRHSLRNLLLYMIRDSDNAAADMILERIGSENVEQTMRQLGVDTLGPVVPLMDIRRTVYRTLDPRADKLSAIQVRDIRWRNGYQPRLDLLKKHIGSPEGVYDVEDLAFAHDRYYELGRNHASMRSIGRLLESLARGELVSEQASHEMLELLERTWTSGRRIEGRLHEGIPVAHKTGTQRERICDLGILWLPDGSPLILAIAVQGGERLEAEDVIADIARAAYELAWMEAGLQPLGGTEAEDLITRGPKAKTRRTRGASAPAAETSAEP